MGNIRIMTANIWGDYFGNAVEPREKAVADVVARYVPDVVGFQEVTPAWRESVAFRTLRDNYALIGCGDVENYTPLAVRQSADVLACGFELLRETPDRSKSVTWAVLRNGDDTVAVCGTHFWWPIGPEHDAIREKNAAQLAELMESLTAKYFCPAIAFGDLNCLRSSGVFRIFTEHAVRHLWDEAEIKNDVASWHGDPKLGEDGVYRGQRTDKDHTFSIDHIVALGDCRGRKYSVIEDDDILGATDHSPVCAEIEF